jgi:hypothetical protein
MFAAAQTFAAAGISVNRLMRSSERRIIETGE